VNSEQVNGVQWAVYGKCCLGMMFCKLGKIHIPSEFNMKNEQFQQNLIRWAESRADVQAVLLVGSLARDDHPADSWSDVDLILFVEDVEVFAREESWLAGFGKALLPVFERHESGDGEWLVLFADGQRWIFILRWERRI
jgi:hypothetical protein